MWLLMLISLNIVLVILSTNSHRQKYNKKYDILSQISNTFQVGRNESAALMTTLFKKKKHSHIIYDIDYSNVRLITRGDPPDLFNCESNASLPVWLVFCIISL